MEREINYEVGNGQLMSQKQIVSENEPTEREFDRERELADVVYIFTTPDKPGIKFYDRTPKGAVAQMTGILPEGKYITDIHSMSKVSWDESLNKENTTNKVMTRDGEVVVKTIMVTVEQLNDILDEIIRQKDGERIVVDTRKKKIENEVNYDNLVQLKNNLISNLPEYNNIDPNKNNFGDDSSSFSK